MTTRQKTIGIILLIATIVATSGIIYLWDTNNKLRNHLAQLESQQAAQVPNDAIQNSQQLHTIDELLFAGRFTEALQQYQQLQADSAVNMSNETALTNRLTIAQSLIVATSAARAEQPVPVTRDSISLSRPMATREQTKQVTNSPRKTTDSLETKITELNRKLSARERALEEKEQLKAIAIQGPQGQTIQYVGDTRNGMAHGSGTGVWDASGGTYNGDWQENKRHGYGVYNWKDGVRYEGDYRHDQREGKGSYFWPSGERYIGQWKNNKRQGQGILYDKDGNVSYEGNWENDKPKRK